MSQSAAARRDRYGPVWWSTVFAANLVVPLHFGLERTREDGRLGMIFGMAALWVGGIVACWRDVRTRLALTIGGVFVAFSQIVPLMQMIAGLIGLHLWDKDLDHHVLSTLGGGFTVTIITGPILIVVAFIIGYLVCLLFGPPDSTPTDADNELNEVQSQPKSSTGRV